VGYGTGAVVLVTATRRNGNCEVARSPRVETPSTRYATYKNAAAAHTKLNKRALDIDQTASVNALRLRLV
jgi:hypothetical protein